jgi:hypothetical protein
MNAIPFVSGVRRTEAKRSVKEAAQLGGQIMVELK